ncbi:MAG TPA: Type 1 glutamine amidotransferase-like domain-containing protein [Thermoanaerobaculia bacterium]
MTTIKPIFLLADSQLLFWRDEEGKPFLGRAKELLEADEAGKDFTAAYLGASNGDAPEFYELFVAAMMEIGIRNTRMIPSRPESEDLKFFKEADLILLAGGDVRQGWEAFQSAGLEKKMIERYYGGALLIGISAGAVQLGLKGLTERSGLFDTFRIVPFVVDAHDEPAWTLLNRAIPKLGEHARGFGIPAGGGALYHPDYSVEPVRHPLVEVTMTEQGTVRQALLFPGETVETEPPPGPSPETLEALGKRSGEEGTGPFAYPSRDDEPVH